MEHISLESLAKDIVGEHRVANPVLAQRLIRQAALRETGGADPTGMARTLAPVVRELFRAGADLETETGSERSRRALRLAREYRALLREVGMLDPAEVLAEATLVRPERRGVHVRGYPRLGAQEAAFLDAIAGEGSTLHLPFAEDPVFAENGEAAEGLRGRGWTVKESPIPEPWDTESACSVKALPHREEEVREALCRVKELLASGVGAGEIVVVARDAAAYGPTVLAVAREYGVPVEALYQVPLTGTRLGSWLGSLLAAAEENFPYEQTARILAHPLGRGLSDGQWREVRRRQPRGISGWREAGVELSGPGWPGDWPVSDSRAGWAGRLGGLIEAHRLHNGVLPWVAERTALARLRKGIGWIGQAHGLPDDAGEAPLTREEFVDEVREVLGALTVPVQPEGRGVALHTPLSLFGARYRYVFALGMAEGTFPAPVAEDPALDFHERKRLRPLGVRLELAGERARRERLSFWMLLQVPSESLTFSYPKLGGRREALPSPFLTLVGAKEKASSPRPAASVKEARSALLRTGPERLEDPVLEHAVRSWEVELRREGSGGFNGHDGVTGLPIPYEEREFSVTELRDLAGCGFKWWAGSVLGLSEPEEGEPPTLFGRLLHDTLELAVKRGTERAGDGEVSLEDPEDLRKLLLENLDAAFNEAERRLGTERLRAWGIRREACLEMLRDAVRGEDFVEAGTAAAEVEAQFGGEWRGIRVRGRVDRLDRGQRGVSLVDYKLGGSAPSPNLQLPIYRETAAPDLAPGERVQSVYYFSISNGEKVKAKWPTDGELEEMAEEIRRKLSTGEFPPDAPVRDPQQKACELCGFDAVCRKGARLSRKSLVPLGEGE